MIEIFDIPVPGFPAGTQTYVVTRTGEGDMGDVSDRKNMKARLAPGVPFILTSVRGRAIAGSDQTAANLQICVDHGAGGELDLDEDIDFVLDEWENFGFDSTKGNHKWGHSAPEHNEYSLYAFGAQTHVVCTWSDPGETRWALEYRYLVLPKDFEASDEGV